MSKKRYRTDQVYELMSGPYDDSRPEYSHVKPAVKDNGQFSMVDCWICNEEGDIHPGYNVSPVPVLVEEFVT
jgi:hypothetical protein